MDTIPMFLKLLESNNLLLSIILSCNIEYAHKYEGTCDIPTDQSCLWKNFYLSDVDSFDLVMFRKNSEESMAISFIGSDSKYLENISYYFGDDSIYRYVFEKAKNKPNIPHPNKFKFDNWKTPIFISVRQLKTYSYSISLIIGDEANLYKQYK